MFSSKIMILCIVVMINWIRDIGVTRRSHKCSRWRGSWIVCQNYDDGNGAECKGWMTAKPWNIFQYWKILCFFNSLHGRASTPCICHFRFSLSSQSACLESHEISQLWAGEKCCIIYRDQLFYSLQIFEQISVSIFHFLEMLQDDSEDSEDKHTWGLMIQFIWTSGELFTYILVVFMSVTCGLNKWNFQLNGLKLNW